MGLFASTVKLLVSASRSGVSFRQTLTVGRQNVFVLDFELRKLLQRYPDLPGLAAVAREQYAEPLLRLLGAQEVSSLDASEYEKATIIHDMNQPVPAELHDRFDAVIDGGTLEHVFNFPTAIKNCMEMVKPGGHLLLHTPVNNQCGHGFYQLSPELFYRVLAPENGFTVERMIAHEVLPEGQWYEVADPAVIHKRVEIINSRRVMMFVRARKERRTTIFQKTPQQSDYVSTWTSTSGEAASTPSTPARPSFLRGIAEATLGSCCPGLLIKLLEARARQQMDRQNRILGFANREMYRPVDE